MKKLGYTDSRNVLVELTEDEYKGLIILQRAIRGDGVNSIEWVNSEYITGMDNLNIDLSNVLKSIKNFALIRASLNETKRYIELLEETLREGS